MTRIAEATLACTVKPAAIYTPLNIAEQTRASGFAFSKRQLVAGDYIRFEWANGGQHSGIFVEYIDDPMTPSDSTSIRTIEGNASSTVLIATRQFKDILSVGNC